MVSATPKTGIRGKTYLQQGSKKLAISGLNLPIIPLNGVTAYSSSYVKAELPQGSYAVLVVSGKVKAKYASAEARFNALGGYAAEAEAAAIAGNLGLKEQVLSQPLKTLSGGQRRRIELARILFSDAQTMILDEPTNHLDADSVVWLREFLKGYQGGLIVISHDVDLIGETVNRVFYLDAMRGVIDVYNMGWKAYLKQREADEERRIQREAEERAAAAKRDEKSAGRDSRDALDAAVREDRKADRIEGKAHGPESDLGRSRSEHGAVGTLTRRWECNLVDRDKITVDAILKLFPFINEEAISAAGYKWMMAQSQENRSLPGFTMEQVTVSMVR